MSTPVPVARRERRPDSPATPAAPPSAPDDVRVDHLGRPRRRGAWLARADARTAHCSPGRASGRVHDAGAALAGRAALHAARPRAHRFRLSARPRLPGSVPVHARHGTQRSSYAPVDDGAGHRLRARPGLGEARTLHAGPGSDGAHSRARPADDQRLRLRPSAGQRRSRPCRARDRCRAGRRGGARRAVRQAQVPDVGLQCAAARQSRDDHRGARTQGCRPAQFHAAHGQRHPDRVHLRRPLHLSAQARPAHRDRRDRVRRAPPSELDAAVDHRRAALRGAREPGAGTRLLDGDRGAVPRRRDRARHRRRHARAVLPLRDRRRHGFLRVGLQAARLSQALGAHAARALRRKETRVAQDPHHDVARHDVAHAAATAQQRLAAVDDGARLRARRRWRSHDDAVARRGARVAVRGCHPCRCGDPAHRRARDGCRGHGRSARGLVLRREL